MRSAAMYMPMAQRVDVALSERGIVKSRSRAKALIAEQKVLLNGVPVAKPSVLVGEGDVLTLEADLPYVGRGGLKLEGALQAFALSLAGRVCMDIGASTGGFTDCMLQNGAARVYAIDVGHGQLDAALCRNPAVVNMEGTDIRRLTGDMLPQTPDFAGIDVSFISLRLVLPTVYALLADRADCAALIKPQFEAGRAQIGKRGIVKSAGAHVQVLTEILAFSREVGFAVKGLCLSPIHGGDGNVEYLVHLTKGQGTDAAIPDLKALAAAR